LLPRSGLERSDFVLGSIATKIVYSRDFRFTPVSDQIADLTGGRFRVKNHTSNSAHSDPHEKKPPLEAALEFDPEIADQADIQCLA